MNTKNLFFLIYFAVMCSSSYIYSTFLCITNHTIHPLTYRMLKMNKPNDHVKHKQEIAVELNMGATQTHSLPDDGKTWHVSIHGDPYESMPLSGARVHRFLLPAHSHVTCAIRDRPDRRQIEINLTAGYAVMNNMILNLKKI